MIVSNPILYRKIIMAYKSSQRQLEKDNFKFRRISNKKEGSETHYQKMQSNIQETYNAPIEDKRTIAFTIYR
jgi:chaperonin cofactor prefoldin